LEADLEIQALLNDVLNLSQVGEITLDMSHAGLLAAILGDFPPQSESLDALYSALQTKDLPGLNQVLNDWPSEVKSAVLALANLSGSPEKVLVQARQNLPKSAAVKAALEELERVKRFGFSNAELERAKKNTLSNYERSWNNRDKSESEDFVDEYISNFTDEEPVPGIDAEFTLVKKLLPQISIAEVNEVTNFFKNENNRFSYITGPDADLKYKLPNPDQIIALLDVKASDKNIKPYEEKVVSTVLLTNMPKVGKVNTSKKNEILGTTELVLSNGVKVTLKQTDFKNDQILFSALWFSPGQNLTIIVNSHHLNLRS
jgi:hypothetical protein